MIKEIVKDEAFLSQPAEPATADDAQVAQDLIDTMESLDDCVCLASNQIGSTKAVIAYEDNGRIYVMYNPKMTAFVQPYTTMEGLCVARGAERGQALQAHSRLVSGACWRQLGEPYEEVHRLDGRDCAARTRSPRW